MATNLENQFIDESYQKLVQISGSYIADGTGSTITELDLDIIGSASYALTASKLEGSIESASFATTASYAENADQWNGQFSGSAGITGSLTFPQPSGLAPVDTPLVIQGGTGFSLGTITGVGNMKIGKVGTSQISSSDGGFIWDRNNQQLLISKVDTGQNPLIGLGFPSYYLGTNNYPFLLRSESLNITVPIYGNVTGSLEGTASYAVSATSSSYASTSVSSSYALSADTSISSSYTLSASHADLADLATLATNSTYSDNTVVYGKNLSGSPIAKGTPLYFTGSGTSGNLVGVYPADASNPLRMPAAGVAGETLTAPGGEGVILLDGFINGVDTSGFNSGDAVYVAVGGGYTNERPTGSAVLVQSLGYIEKVALNGSGVIKGSGRANDIPNLQQGYFFVGGTGDVGTTVASSSFAKVAENNVFTGTQTFNNIAVNGTGSFAYIQSVTGSAKIIGDNYIILNNDTPTERYAGIVVQDSGSGSPLTTASLEFDGQSNDWFYEYSDDGGATTDHGVVLFGPEYATKGTPTYNTANTILKSDGGHHVLDSSITDTGALVTVSNPLTVTGTITGDLTGNVTGNATTATSASHALNADTAITANTATNASFASAAATASYVDYANVDNKPALVSSSAQIDVTATQNYVTPVDLTTNQTVGGEKVFTDYTVFGDGVQGGIGGLAGSGTVTLDISSGTFFASVPTGAVTYAVTGAPPSGAGMTVSFLIDNQNSQTVSFTGVQWPGGTAPTITPGGKDIITLVTIGTQIFGVAVQNLS